MALQDFIQKYYIDPLLQDTPYNVYNTLTYAVILVISVIILYRLSRKYSVKIDKNFFIGILPYIALGGVLRSMEDLFEATNANQNLVGTVLEVFLITLPDGAARNVLLVTPLMYFTVFAIAFAAIVFSKLLEHFRKIEYHKTWFFIGTVILLYSLLPMRLANAEALWLVPAIAFLAVSGVFVVRFLARNTFLKSLFTKENTLILSVHMFDATTTFVAMQFFNYIELHVLPSFVISIFGPVSMFFLKFIVVSAVLYYLDRDMKDGEQKNLIKIAIVVLGLAPGIRNFLIMVMGV